MVFRSLTWQSDSMPPLPQLPHYNETKWRWVCKTPQLIVPRSHKQIKFNQNLQWLLKYTSTIEGTPLFQVQKQNFLHIWVLNLLWVLPTYPMTFSFILLWLWQHTVSLFCQTSKDHNSWMVYSISLKLSLIVLLSLYSFK